MDKEKNTSERGIRKTRIGIVKSSVQDKTIVVEITNKKRHKRYKKVITSSKKYYAHDEKNEAENGDTVLIAETRPYSKTKRWRLIKIQEKHLD